MNIAPTNPASAMFTLNDIYNKLDTRAAVAMRTNAFNEPTGGPTNGTMHTLNEIMMLVTNRAPTAKTGQTVSYDPAGTIVTNGSSKDDGYYRAGVAWPNPRFAAVAASGPETNQIRDNLTGLIWTRNANIASNLTLGTWSTDIGTCTWVQAVDVITNSAGPVNGTLMDPNGYGGTNDWRMPNIVEMNSLLDWQFSSPTLSDGTGTQKWTEARGPFTGVKGTDSAHCYWTSTTYDYSKNYAWRMAMYVGVFAGINKTTGTGYVWPVRGGR